jgi:hypothetical protein
MFTCSNTAISITLSFQSSHFIRDEGILGCCRSSLNKAQIERAFRDRKSIGKLSNDNLMQELGLPKDRWKESSAEVLIPGSKRA